MTVNINQRFLRLGIWCASAILAALCVWSALSGGVVGTWKPAPVSAPVNKASGGTVGTLKPMPAAASVTTSSEGTNDVQKSATEAASITKASGVRITVLENLTTPYYLMSAKLSPSHHYLAVYDDDGSLSIYRLSPSLTIQRRVFTTKGQKYVINKEYEWAGDTLLLSVIRGPKEWSYVHSHSALRDTAVLCYWTPGARRIRNLFSYNANDIVPDRTGRTVAIIDPTKPLLKKPTMIIYDLKQKRIIKRITLKGKHTNWWDFEYALGWGNNSRELYVIRKNAVIDGKQLLYMDLNGTFHTLTPPVVKVAGEFASSIIASDEGELPGVTPTTSYKADFIAALGDVSFPALHIGYFNRHGMVKDITVQQDQTPAAWKRSRGEYFAISPDGKHIIFQDVSELVGKGVNGYKEVTTYNWDLNSNILYNLGKYPFIYEVCGWTNNALLVLVDTRNGKKTVGFIQIDNQINRHKN